MVSLLLPVHFERTGFFKQVCRDCKDSSDNKKMTYLEILTTTKKNREPRELPTSAVSSPNKTFRVQHKILLVIKRLKKV